MKIPKIESIDLAWAAGFFEADGSTCYTNNTLRIQLSQSGHEIPPQLTRFAKIMGVKVNGPYKPTSISKTPVYQVIVSGGKAKWALSILRPYLTDDGPKLLKAEADLQAYEGRDKCASYCST